MKFREIALFSDQVDQVSDFYESLFNEKPMHRGAGISFFQIADTLLMIHGKYVPHPDELPCENHLAFQVTDLDETVDGLQQRHVAVQFSPKDYPWGRSAYLRDPDGHLIELHETPPATVGDNDR